MTEKLRVSVAENQGDRKPEEPVRRIVSIGGKDIDPEKMTDDQIAEVAADFGELSRVVDPEEVEEELKRQRGSK